MALRIAVIIVCSLLICFSVFRLKADIDMKTARQWFGHKNIERALHYNKSAIAWNPTEIKYYINLQELEQIFLNILQSNEKKVVIRRRKNVE
ncbi:MAG TPA: hypothetical protein ENH85_11200 [Candidatus Scalindua sp.]|nr:hypothetical protein [Candidatus Scalindua sp.]